MSKEQTPNEDASLSEMLDETAEPAPARKRSRLSRAAGWVGGVTMVSLALSGLTIPSAMVASAGVHAADRYWDSLDGKMTADEIPLPQRTVLLDKNGKKFAQFYSENFLNALISTEDVRFYENNGFDPIGLARAFVSTTSGGQKQGASGITQQLVKTLQIMNAQSAEERAEVQSRTIPVKMQEIKYAVQMEEKYTKEQILEMYINTVYFGNGAYGIQAAARTYFDTTPDKLTTEQAATLVGVINNPTLYDPQKNPENSKNRRDKVLERLYATNKISEAEYKELTAKPIELKRGQIDNGCKDSDFPFYCEYVKKEVLSNPAFGDTYEDRQRFLQLGGVTLKTALDPAVMKKAEAEAKRAYGAKNRIATGIAVVQPGTGQIVAMAQNHEYGSGDNKTQVVYADTEHQPGSSFKPLTMATALEKGYDGNTVLNSDSFYKPVGYDSPGRGFTNFGFANYGSVRGADALRMSLNVWFVRMTQTLGVETVRDMANRLGTSIPRVEDGGPNGRALSITLGTYGASPLEMATAYATFASGGVKCNPVSIIGAKNTKTGEELPFSDPDCHQEVSSYVANNMTEMMQGPFKAGGTMQGRALSGGREAGVKTGTTNANSDAWTVGMTPQYSVAVWAGDPRGSQKYPMDTYTIYGQTKYRAQGSQAAGPVWLGIMESIHQGLAKEKFAKPSSSILEASSRNAPNVVGLDVDTAITTLRAQGLRVEIAQETKAGSNKVTAKNIVVDQDPAAGEDIGKGEVVRITLSPGSDIDMIVDPEEEEK